MGHHFEGTNEVELDATAEQVWQAIATGPGIDSWYMGRSEVEPGQAVRTVFGGYRAESTVTAWDPLERLAYHTGEAPDGRYLAYEFLVEGRERGSTVLRMVVSGFLPGDDWGEEYEAMTKGGALFFGTLVEYLTHFAGRTATPVTVFGPPVADWDSAWAVVHRELGLDHPPVRGDRVAFTPDGLDRVEGVVFFANEQTVGVRADQAMYRFVQGLRGGLIACNQAFTEIDRRRVEQGWQAWLDRLFG
jgi:uncharacterized protein YndB with AHSA1/START domain